MQFPGVTLRVLKMKPLKKVGEDRGKKKDKYRCTQSGLNTSRQWNNVFHSDLLGAYFKSKLIKNFLRPDQVFLFYTSMVADKKLWMFTPSSIAHWPVGPVCEPPNKVWTPLLPCRSSSSVHPASLWPPPELSGTFVLHPDQKKNK